MDALAINPQILDAVAEVIWFAEAEVIWFAEKELHLTGLQAVGILLENGQCISRSEALAACQDIDHVCQKVSYDERPDTGELYGLFYGGERRVAYLARLELLQSWLFDLVDDQPQQASEIESNTPNRQSAENDLVEPLTENDWNILQAMFEMNLSKSNHAKQDLISKTALGNECDPKKAFIRLLDNGLVESKTGRGGGMWLTDKGRELCQNRFGTVSHTD